MGHCCYILHSEKLSKYYVGYSSNLDVRLEFHKNPESRKFTNNAKDWTLFYTIECISKPQGKAIETHIKRMKSKVYIQNLKKYPDIAKKLFNEYKDC